MKIYELFIVCWMIVGVAAGSYLFYKDAPYGRFTKTDWGPMISNRLGWFFMELTVMVAFAWRLAGGPAWLARLVGAPGNGAGWLSPAGFMVGLFFLHYIHRSLVYPWMIRTSGKKMPVMIMLSAMLFNLVNGSLLGIWFSCYGHYSVAWLGSFQFIAGTLLFFLGMGLNWWSDYMLIRLRGRGETGYKLPSAGLFRYITSPNLFGEIIEWGGYALLTWSLPALAFFVWTCANLVPRAVANRRWYRRQFPDYPAERKRLIPFIW
jgi:3-oxo-5-alpha-steroid 4-dehydrogenase 1